MNSPITWPAGKRFAFTIFDDTDWATVDSTGPVYRLLLDLGLLTTKSVWPLAPEAKPRNGGGTLAESRYCEWVLDLQRQGFEIAFHGATSHPSCRERTIQSLDDYRRLLGHDPVSYAMHVGQAEAMYWGAARLDGLASRCYKGVLHLLRERTSYLGHREQSPYFWGDVCRGRITYVRNLTFADINTIKRDPFMPYHDPHRPYVRYWFSASDGSDLRRFCTLLAEENQDRLVDEGGACIVYTHFGRQFLEAGELNPRFVTLMQRLARLPGWFVPAATLLDYLRDQREEAAEPDPRTLQRIQWNWLMAKFKNGRS